MKERQIFFILTIALIIIFIDLSLQQTAKMWLKNPDIEDSGIDYLTDTNLTSTIAANDYYLVQYYSLYDGYSIRQIAHLKEIAAELAALTPPIKIGLIKISQTSEDFTKYDIEFPRLKFWIKGTASKIGFAPGNRLKVWLKAMRDAYIAANP